ncbi:MAG TPA: dihydroorotate dehydrogenase electron transfer subunit, partial [Clostridiales bacterium UBA8960]|nr:dihydroorotate dehydrogenase electron transfer subunit [Clostridiales bacterium UBA8960]
LSQVCVDDEIEVMGPLGNGFDLEAYENEGKRLLVVGGGIGVAPIKGLVEALSNSNHEIDVIIGFRDLPYLDNELKKHSQNLIVVSENDASYVLGYVTQPFESALKSRAYDMIFACGPDIMLNKLAAIANGSGNKIQLLMEEKMACGIGACLVCTCKTREGDFGFKHVRMCKEGPVFYGSEVIFDEA